MPRPEEVPEAAARVKEAEASSADASNQLALAESVRDKRAISEDQLLRRRYAVQVAEARLAQARAQLALLKAGSWKPDIEVARAEVAAAEAQLQATETDIESFPEWSPDGKSIAYTRQVRGEDQLFVQSLASPVGTQITSLPGGCD